MNDEIQALTHNHTWKFNQVPQGKKVIGCKCFYETRFHSDGTIKRNKAQLVEKGFK